MDPATLKSVHITNYYHKNSGGISTAYNEVLKAANRHRRFVRLIVPGESDEIEEVGEYGRIYFVKAGHSPFFDKRYRVMMPWNAYIFDNTPIRRILRQEQPDIIEIGEKYTLSLLGGLIRRGFFRSLGRPLLIHYTCERMDDNLRAFVSGAKPLRWLAKLFMGNYVFPMFDYHLANSQYTAQELIDSVSNGDGSGRGDALFTFCWRLFGSTPKGAPGKVFINNCGVDRETFSPSRRSAETRRKMLIAAGFPENASVLLYAGRISPEKNVKLLPKVLNSLVKFRNYDSQGREYRLLVAGDGPQKAWLERELERRSPGKYKIMGHVSDREELADIYANSDIFLHANPREPFGIAPLEAMASGLPVVASRSGGVLSYANDENAWLGECEVEDYFVAVRDIFNDDARRERKIEKALITARDYSWKKSTDKLFELYDRMFVELQQQKSRSAVPPAVGETIRATANIEL